MNNVQSEGCPLTSLIVALAIEPLAIALRANPETKGILRNGSETKGSVYADDLLLCVSDWNSFVPAADHITRIWPTFRLQVESQ